MRPAYALAVRLVVPDPPLSDGLVLLRPPTDDDTGWLTAACNDPVIARFVVDLPSPYTERDAHEFLGHVRRGWELGSEASFVVADAVGSSPLGLVDVHFTARGPEVASVGYWLRPEGRGRGAATSAVRLVACWAFALGVRRLELTAAPDNVASQGVAQRAGFTREGLLREWLATQSGRRDSVMFSLLPADAEGPR